MAEGETPAADGAGLLDEIARIRAEAEAALARGDNSDAVRSRTVGRSGRLREITKSLRDVAAGDRPRVGQAAQEAIRRIEERLAEAGPVRAARADVADLGRTPPPVAEVLLHPLRETEERILEAFESLGFALAEGPEIETDRNNFTDLGFPEEHPARDAQDTFFLDAPPGPDGTALLLRTHTSPVQLRAMELMLPPLRLLIPGRTYRSDAPDASHSPIFHQVEGLVVEEGITFAHLKGTLAVFAKKLFGRDRTVRFRPSYFPFTEPSAEVDVSCPPCPVCKNTGWLEILGAGLVSPFVFESVCRRRGDARYDPAATSGFAFGMGVERIAMIRHGVTDMRLFFENDLRFLRAYRADFPR